MSSVAPPPATTHGDPAPRPAVPTARARADAAVRLGALGALWSGALLVTYWWAAGGGLLDLGGWRSGLTSLGRLAGLVGSELLLVQVLLMARIPLLEGAFGQDRLARIHRWVGFCSFDLVLAHAVLITWGYAAGSLTAVPGTFWQVLTHDPTWLLAVLGTACLVAVVVTSTRAARRKLRYESWHLVHLWAYLGVGLALPHQLLTGQEFTSSPGRTVFWWGLWGAALLSVLVWRIGVPLVRNLRHDVRVSSVVPEAPGVVSVYMTGRDLHLLPVEAGQFMGFRFLAGRGWTRSNPFSLSAAPDGRSLRITVREVGDGSARLRHLAPGTRVLVEGPHGRLTARARTRRKVALIGAGVGVTPLRALAEGLDHTPGEVVLLQRYRDRPLFEWEFGVLAAERGLRVVDLPGRRRAPGSWLGEGAPPLDDVALLRRWLPDVAEHDVYVCGPRGWAADVRRTALAAGVPPEQLHVEEFAW
ncbi:ferredoxin reductase family protein [Kineococcus glutinatus]|uniref:Ferric reductase-like transmembrane domain-containing protein n=1 Tax=Kineococcus glutinatus TaxID=1070872 RepID=A0ABP9I844_9ACTN